MNMKKIHMCSDPPPSPTPQLDIIIRDDNDDIGVDDINDPEPPKSPHW